MKLKNTVFSNERTTIKTIFPKDSPDNWDFRFVNIRLKILTFALPWRKPKKSPQR